MSIKRIMLKDGSVKWEATAYSQGRLGKKLRRRFDKKVEAQDFLVNYLKEKKDIQQTQSSEDAPLYHLEDLTLNQEIEHWIGIKGNEFSEGYWRVINPGLKLIRSLYGNYTLSKVTPGLLLSFRKILQKRETSISTQNRYCELIFRIINFSFQQGRISKNTLSGFKSQKESNEGISFWSESEVSSFLEFTGRKYPVGHDKRWVFVAYLFLLETGVRARELWGLQMKDYQLDSSSNTIQISRQLARSGKYTPTKGKDIRLVPISNGLKKEMDQLIGHGQKEFEGSARSGRENVSSIFRTQQGTPIDHDNFVKRVFLKDLYESRIKKIRFHDLRHTAITLMVKRNITPWIVQKIAGHRDLKTTMRYVHIVGSDIEKIGEAWSLHPAQFSKEASNKIGQEISKENRKKSHFFLVGHP